MNPKKIQAKTRYYYVTLCEEPTFQSLYTDKIIITKKRIKVWGKIVKYKKYCSKKEKIVNKRIFKTTKKTKYCVLAGVNPYTGRKNIQRMSKKKFYKKVKKLIRNNTGLGLVIKYKDNKVIYARLVS